MITPKFSFTDQQTNFIIENYNKLGPKKIAEILNVTPKQISKKRYILKCNGIKLYTSHDTISKNCEITRLKNQKPLNEYAINTELFINPINSETSYLLGFLWGDGYVYFNKKTKRYVIGSGFSLEDFKDIEHIFKFHGRWGIREYYKKNRKPQIRLRTTNNPLGKFLESMDYRSKSKSPDKIINIIPNHLLHYFFRGLFDADGCIHTLKSGSVQVSISSCFDQDWNFIEKLNEKLNIKFKTRRRKHKTGNNSIVLITANNECKVFLEYIYKESKNDKIFLKRKYNKTITFLKYIENKKPNSSIYKGVCKTVNGWQSRYCANGYNKHLGTFKTEIEAHNAYEEFKKSIN